MTSSALLKVIYCFRVLNSMLPVLKAIYHNGTFILQTDYSLPEGLEVELLIQSPQIVSPSVPDASNGQKMAAALSKLAHLDPFNSIDDPIAWQQEIRQDRAIGDREP
jgi:predicted DNA-binding antitoxin AbrB/MazE fold protein